MKPSNQPGPQVKTLAPVAVALFEDVRAFEPADNLLNSDTQPSQATVVPLVACALVVLLADAAHDTPQQLNGGEVELGATCAPVTQRQEQLVWQAEFIGSSGLLALFSLCPHHKHGLKALKPDAASECS